MIKYKASAKYVLITFASKTESVKMKKEEEKRIDGVFFSSSMQLLQQFAPKNCIALQNSGEKPFSFNNWIRTKYKYYVSYKVEKTFSFRYRL